MFECGGIHTSTVQDVLKSCSQYAVFSGRQVVLLVGSEISDENMMDICTFMKQGDNYHITIVVN